METTEMIQNATATTNYRRNIIILSFASIILIPSLILNSLLIYIIVHVNKRRIRANYILILNNSLTGLFSSILLLPIVFAAFLPTAELNCNRICSVLMILENTLVISNIWGVACIAADRYAFIGKGTAYKTCATVKKASFAALGVWTLSITFGGAAFFLSKSYEPGVDKRFCICHLTIDFYGIYHLLYSATFVSIGYLLPSTFFFFFYAFVLKAARNRADRDTKNPFRGDVTGQPSCQFKFYRVKAIRIVCVVLILYTLQTLPYFCTHVTKQTPTNEEQYIESILFLLLLLTSSVSNPIVYGLFNSRLRTSLLCYFKRKIKRRSNRSKNTDLSMASEISALSERNDHQECEDEEEECK
ncbi:DgyrCDS11263 [Dimorphilus gyrociliatus]|uniref:DgyrCDS11263 n=1 Tax=Dimorphilus gyrociliatus TaxID=2664684 RepID=A0A7I8W2R2_9ANNE|nr:DgyrCDS11263 [Dimorphilus gyrociliatus]